MLAKDTEIEITNIYSGYNSNFYKGIFGDREVVIDANAIKITDYSQIINWEQRRYENLILILMFLFLQFFVNL